MAVAESRSKFFEAKTRVESCRASISELQVKTDRLQESLPKLSGAVEDAEKAKTAALDDFALSSNKTTEVTLKAARQNCDDASKKLVETNELVGAIARTLKKQEQELVRLNTACDLAKRQCWESIAGDIRLGIPEAVVSDMQHLVVASMQCSMTKQFIISELLPNLNPSEYQARCGELIEKYGLIE